MGLRAGPPLVFLLLATLCACYEIPPPLLDFGEPTEPLQSAYVEDPYHPASLFFQRAFGRRGPDRALVARDPALLLPAPRPWATIDCVEVLAILESLDPRSVADPVRRAVLRSDALRLAARLRVEDDVTDADRLCDAVVHQLLRVALAP